jgi:hypothetical protein
MSDQKRHLGGANVTYWQLCSPFPVRMLVVELCEMYLHCPAPPCHALEGCLLVAHRAGENKTLASMSGLQSGEAVATTRIAVFRTGSKQKMPETISMKFMGRDIRVIVLNVLQAQLVSRCCHTRRWTCIWLHV